MSWCLRRDDRGGAAKWQSVRAPALALVLGLMLLSDGDGGWLMHAYRSVIVIQSRKLVSFVEP
jgi:hypothetical protein